jgi:hypothetical protein
MPETAVLYRSFAGGVVTPEFWGQIADAKFQTGLAECLNYVCLPHGPVNNRAGTQYVTSVKDSTKATRLIPFLYSTDQTFAIELGAGYFRFHTQGATLLAGSPAAYNGATAYVPGGLVSSGGLNYYCIANTTGNAPPNATYWYALPANGFYEIPNPYAEADLFNIHYVQSQDVLTLVHQGYAVMELRRLGATNWVLSAVSFVSTLSAPTSPSAVATVGAGATTYTYVITAVDTSGREESLASASASCTNNLLTTGNYNTITHAAVSGAGRYNIYKQSNGLYGFIGQTDALTFKDDNITADLSRTPPTVTNPFGSAGNYPGAVSYYEQRRVFAGTINKPQNINMTFSGTESNMSYHIPANDSDAISFRVAARENNTIRHLVPLDSLIALTSSAEWRVTAVNSDAITSSSISVKPQSYIGASMVQPIIVNNNLIFAAARGGHLREMGYSFQTSGYTTGDLSLRAPHLFDNYALKDMSYAKCPYPIVWATSTSGELIGLTYVPEQQIGAFHHHTTATLAGQSYFESVCTVPEGDEDANYYVVKRIVDGDTVRYIERQHTRVFTELKDAFFVDCGLTYDNPITITGATQANPCVITAVAHGLSNDDFVDITGMTGTLLNAGMLELNGNRYKIANVTANTFSLKTEVGAAINSTAYGAYVSGGVARKALLTITGIDHLEGETVSILGDGAVRPQLTVTGGAITLDHRAGVAQIGLPITADMQTLPAVFQVDAFAQGRQKNVKQLHVRVNQSSGIFAGPSFDSLTEVKQRSTEPYGSPPELKAGEVTVKVKPTWTDGGQVCVRQSDPLPLTILSLTVELSIGG